MNIQNYEEQFRTAAYIRLSKEDGDKEESDSVCNQRNLLINYIDQHSDLFLYDMYIDDGYSGTNFTRPGFQRMLADIKEGKLNCIIVKDLSRFGRDYIETGRYLERVFPDYKVRFIAIADGIDSQKKAYDLLLPIKNLFNEQYARDISEKIQATIKTKQKSGEFIGAFASYGYKKSPVNKNKLIIDEYAASVVRKIFSLYVSGMGKQSIAKLLNKEGILCPSAYKNLKGEHYKNSNRLNTTSYWTYSTINNILKNELYIGNMIQGKKRQCLRGKQTLVDKAHWIRVENTHPPIIQQDIWHQCQRLLKTKTQNIDFHKNVNLFSGLLKCGDCGRSMIKNSWSKSDGSISCSFSCGTYKRNGKAYCTSHTLSYDILERILLDDLKCILHNIQNLQELAEMQLLLFSKKDPVDESELYQIKKELEKIKAIKKSMYIDYKHNLISKEEFLSYRNDYSAKEQLYNQQIEILEKNNQQDAPHNNIQDYPWLIRLLDLGYIEKLDRDTVIEMVRQITVYENRRICITYNFSNNQNILFHSIFNPSCEETGS